MRWAAVVVVSLAFGCADVRLEDDAGGGAGGTGGRPGSGGAPGAGGSPTSSTTSGPEGGGGLSGTGGGGGEAPKPAPCGNGALDAGEECDDGNSIAGDGCSDLCVFECEPFDPASAHEAVWKDPTTLHCYRWAGGLAPEPCGVATFAMAEADCADWGGSLAALSTLVEWELVIASGIVAPSALDVFLGGRDESGTGDWVWSNGEPWIYTPNSTPWSQLEPVGGTFLEMYYDGTFNADVDASACGWVCERSPD